MPALVQPNGETIVKGSSLHFQQGLVRALVLAGLCALAASAASAAPRVDATKAKALAQKDNCLSCHSVDAKIVGPAYKDVAAKYKKDPKALARLVAKVKSGGKGVWGEVPMPPNRVPDSDIKTIVSWVLSL
jgi:cytochrome c